MRASLLRGQHTEHQGAHTHRCSLHLHYTAVQHFTGKTREGLPQGRARPPAGLSRTAPELSYLHSKVEHQAVRVGFSQFVEEVPPCGVSDHLLQPGWGLWPTARRGLL